MNIQWLIVSVLAVVTLLVLPVIGGVYLGRLRKMVEAQGKVLNSLEQDIRAICQGAKGMGDTVQAMERKLQKVVERQDQLDLREPGIRPYRQAITMVHKGAGVEELVSTCGLARSEAELVHLLHHGEKKSRHRLNS